MFGALDEQEAAEVIEHAETALDGTVNPVPAGSGREKRGAPSGSQGGGTEGGWRGAWAPGEGLRECRGGAARRRARAAGPAAAPA